MTVDKQKRPAYKKPKIKTERVEVRCSPANKDRIHALAYVLEMSVSELMVRGIEPQLEKHAKAIEARVQQVREEANND